MIRTVGARLALVVAGLLAPLLLLELALRLFGPILPGNHNSGSFLTQHPVYGRFQVLGFDGWVKTAEYTSRVTINSLGFRGPERPFDKHWTGHAHAVAARELAAFLTQSGLVPGP